MSTFFPQCFKNFHTNSFFHTKIRKKDGQNNQENFPRYLDFKNALINKKKSAFGFELTFVVHFGFACWFDS